MSYICLIYASKAVGEIAHSVGAILDASERNNPRAGISGMLCSSSSYFLQCMEGPRREISDAFLRIAKDPRHAGIELLQSAESEQRFFPGWSMGYVGNTTEAVDIIEKYMGRNDFNPFLLSAAQALQMLKEMSLNLPSRTLDVLPVAR